MKDSPRAFQGFMRLMDAFQDFVLQSMDEVRTHGHILNVFSVSFVAATARRFRASLNTFYDGYYYDAASGLRSVFESTSYLAAVAGGHIRYHALMDAANRINYSQSSESEQLRVERQVQREIDTKIKEKLRGKDSGLSTSDQHELEMMLVVLHSHVHKASSTVIEMIGEAMVDGRSPSIAPEFDEHKASTFCNTAACVAWTFMRVLPCMSRPSRFSQDWRNRYAVLDRSLRFYLESVDTDLARAFIRFVDLKMVFTEESFRTFEVDRSETLVRTLDPS